MDHAFGVVASSSNTIKSHMVIFTQIYLYIYLLQTQIYV